MKNSSPLFHMQVKLMHKQMELMTLEESNLKRQAKNLDVELKMVMMLLCLSRVYIVQKDATYII